MEHKIDGIEDRLTVAWKVAPPVGPSSKASSRRKVECLKMLKEGDPAPDFTALDHTGKEVRLSGLRGNKVWLWFFSSPGGGN